MRRPALLLALGSLAGALVGLAIPSCLAIAALSGAAFVLAMVLAFVGGRVSPRAPGLARAGVLLAVGFLVVGGRTALVERDIRQEGALERLVSGGPVAAETCGLVVSRPVRRRTFWPSLRWVQLDLELESQSAEGENTALTGRVQAFLPDDDRARGLRYGDRVRLTGKLAGLRGPTNPGQPDFRFSQGAQGVRGRLSVPDRGTIEVLARDQGSSITAAFFGAQARLDARLERRAPGREGALLRAVLLGVRHDLPHQVKDVFERTGTLHLLAISGLHAGLITLMVMLCLRLIRVPRRAAALVALLVSVGYCGLVGARPSVARATIMISVWLLGIVIKREPDGLSALSLACVLVLLWCPRELGLPGFQLSFLAVLGLILLAGPLTTIVTGWLRGGSRRPRRLRTGPRFLIGACASSVVAWIATTPLQILHFHVVTPVGLLINVVASLWLTATIACGTALLLVPEVAAGAVAWASTWLVRGALAVNGTLARWPLAARYLADVVTLRVVLAYAVLLALALWIRYRVRQRARDAACGVTLAAGGRLAWARPALVTALALLIAVACMSPRVAAPPDPGRVRLSVLDVSHGSSALVETAGGASVFDCGSSRLLPGRRVTAPALWSLGHDRIEWLVLSHADSDHVSGVLDLVDRFPIARGVAIGPAFTEARLGRRIVDGLQSRGVLVREVRAGDRLDLGGGVAARVLAGGERTGTRGASVPARHGRGRTRLSENDRSIVVRLESPGSEDGLALFPGDLEDHGTRRLLLDSPGKHLRAQVLVVPHHGAKNRSSRELARAVRPRLALVSSRPGRSASATVGAFEREGARVLETAYDGALTVELGRRKPLRKGRNRSSR